MFLFTFFTCLLCATVTAMSVWATYTEWEDIAQYRAVLIFNCLELQNYLLNWQTSHVIDGTTQMGPQMSLTTDYSTVFFSNKVPWGTLGGEGLPLYSQVKKFSQWDISHWVWTFWPSCGTKGKVRESPKSLGFIIWGPWVSAQGLKWHSASFVVWWYC